MLFLCLCTLLISAASAYIVTIDAPRTLTAGEPLVVNGTSTLPAGYTTDLILYQGAREIARTTIVVQVDRTFTATFDTGGLEGGDYKVELQQQRDPATYGSSSVTSRFVTLIDRSKEVVVTSSTVQTDLRNLTVAGTAAGKKGGSIAITATGPGNFSFGPEYVRTDSSGAFTKSVAIQGAGDYRVSISDPAGVITRYSVSVAASTTVPTTDPTTVITSVPTTVPTTSEPTTAVPTTTKAGISLVPLFVLGIGLALFARRT
jgi:hypothetical protein